MRECEVHGGLTTDELGPRSERCTLAWVDGQQERPCRWRAAQLGISFGRQPLDEPTAMVIFGDEGLPADRHKSEARYVASQVERWDGVPFVFDWHAFDTLLDQGNEVGAWAMLADALIQRGWHVYDGDAVFEVYSHYPRR